MKKLSCFFGLHDYESVRSVTSTMRATIMYIEADVCKCCGKMKRSHRSAAKHMYLMLLASRDRGTVTVHPAVFGGQGK